MLSIFRAIGSLFSLLGAALKGLFTLVVYRQGEKAQAQKDQQVDAVIIQKQRDDATDAGAVDPKRDRAEL